MKYKPFTSKHCTPSRFTSPLKLSGSGSSTNDAVEKQRVKDASKFLGKQAIKQGLKSVGQKALSTVFGVGGMLLSSQKAYGGSPQPKQKSMTWEEVDAFQKQRDAKNKSVTQNGG